MSLITPVTRPPAAPTAEIAASAQSSPPELSPPAFAPPWESTYAGAVTAQTKGFASVHEDEDIAATAARTADAPPRDRPVGSTTR